MHNSKLKRYDQIQVLHEKDSFKHDVMNPMDLVDEMIAKSRLVREAKILILYNVEFAVSILEDYDDIYPQDIYLLHDGDDTVTALCSKLGINPITIKELQLTMEEIMKFDLVIGNPPFQNTHGAKRWTQWLKFVELSKEISNTVAMVTPQSITGPATLNLIKGSKVLNLDVSKHFKESSTFCYWVLDNNDLRENTAVVTVDDEWDINLHEVPFLPYEVDDKSIKLLMSLMKRKNRDWKRGEFHTSKKDLISNRGKYPLFHTNAQDLRVRASFKNENLDKVRVAVTLSGYPEFRVVKGSYCSQATMWTEFRTLKEARAFAKECNSEKIQNILSIFKWSGWNSKEVISML